MTPETCIKQFLDNDSLQKNTVLSCLKTLKLSAEFNQKIEKLLIASDFSIQHLSQNLDWIAGLERLKTIQLDANFLSTSSTAKTDLAEVQKTLRRYRNQKLVEIIYLDVVEKIELERVLEYLSALSDQLIQAALKWAEQSQTKQYGQPLDGEGQPIELNIIAMGKLGGNELNFSSDIDLIFCFGEDGDLKGLGQLSHQEYFTRLVRLFTKLMSEITADGFVYRVDLRLRPWGDSGPVTISHSALEHYYHLHGREWEQYAMVKARIITGSDADKAYLKSIITPFVYRKYHDYRVFEGLAALKDKIDAQANSRNMLANVKIGPGGIREIEFFVQAFQILKGGRNRQLQSSSILPCFDALVSHQVVEASIIQKLRDAYFFLRLLENRLQMFDDQQVHLLPVNPIQQTRIAVTMDFADWESLIVELDQHRNNVSEAFNEIFKRDQQATETLKFDDSFVDENDDARQLDFIRQCGISQAGEFSACLTAFLQSKPWSFMSARAKQRFNILLPELLKSIAEEANQSLTFQRLLKLFSSIAGRSVYFEMLFQNQLLLKKLVLLFGKSKWIADQLAQFPILIDNLIQADALHRFDKSELKQRLSIQLANVGGDTELEMDVLRLFKREQTLVIANAQLSDDIDAIEVGLHLSELAEIILQAVLKLATEDMQQKHGKPCCIESGNKRQANFAIIGYGKLGGHELHYQSDLDVIFLHDSDGEQQFTDGNHTIENSLYFARLAQKIISFTTLLTGSGRLYEIDSRLRPDGSSGLLVSASHAYLRYQLESAWTWEHQALVRARMVAGSESFRAQFKQMRSQVLELKREPIKLAEEITAMRSKIADNKKLPAQHKTNLKYSPGTMIDIEFMVQFWVLDKANSNASICLNSDNISIINELFELGLINQSQSELVEIYQTYHRLLHGTLLQGESAQIDSGLISKQVAHVINCWNECFGAQEK